MAVRSRQASDQISCLNFPITLTFQPLKVVIWAINVVEIELLLLAGIVLLPLLSVLLCLLRRSLLLGQHGQVDALSQGIQEVVFFLGRSVKGKGGFISLLVSFSNYGRHRSQHS